MQKKYLIIFNMLSWKKALKILGRGRNYHHIIKSIYENPAVNIKFTGERLKDVFIAILR